ncbi:DUF6880 family protein [Methylobacterium sp. WL120]|uniref:DUF6880 family protein n=1 Tax=Methylobacterium sp. WL120 TaxID=2603887 RepID=UPI0011C847ED|nr:DUF6880 family protein [Methylobacterium sp. WL120]TXM67570.1 hypothetical protein FV229_09880 [Methylobacterium sp. WL120]
MPRKSATAPLKSVPSAVKPPKGTRRTTPSPETLAALSPDRLIGLILGEAARNAAFKKLVSAALASLQGPEAVAAIVDRRLTALEGARGFIDWQKRRAFTTDLGATVTVILTELATLDRAAALERLVRFLGGADAVLNRVDDGSGAIQAIYERASEAVVAIAADLDPDAAGLFALTLIPRVVADPYGPFGLLIRDLVPRLPAIALRSLDDALAEAVCAGAKPADGTSGTPAIRAGLTQGNLLRIRQDITDSRGDVDAYVALEQAIMPGRPDVIEIARRLLDAGRAAEALDWIRRPASSQGRVVTRASLAVGCAAIDGRARERIALEIRILDALDRREEAQALRWRGFETLLDADMLRAHLAKLPDFEDEEVWERALEHVSRHDDAHRALAFLVAWPSLDRAARLVLARASEWRGAAYRLLELAAEALEPAHPAAAAILLRRMIDDILGEGRSSAYPHAARYLKALDAMAPRLLAGAIEPAPEAYRAGLRAAHGRKYGFWPLVQD